MSEVTQAEIRVTFNRNAPDGQCWACKRCTHRTTVGSKAGAHALTKHHGHPELQPIPTDEMLPDSSKKPELVVRAGDLMQTGEDMRLALEIARIATQLAADAGAPTATVNRLRRMLANFG